MIRLVCVGKMKERYLAEGIEDFSKRISRFSKFEIVEVKDEKILKDKSKIKDAEGERLLRQIRDKEFVIALDETGTRSDSHQLAETMRQHQDIVFLIGGALGLSPDVRKRADLTLSLSKMTFTHQMARLFISEQIYRAFTILNNIEYHK